MTGLLRCDDKIHSSYLRHARRSPQARRTTSCGCCRAFGRFYDVRQRGGGCRLSQLVLQPAAPAQDFHLRQPRLVTIGESAFSGTALNKFRLEFGGNLRTIGNFAFDGGEASYLTFAEGVQNISTGAFLGDFCGISKELILPNSLTSIGATVFEGPYKKIVIGSGITEIGEKHS